MRKPLIYLRKRNKHKMTNKQQVTLPKYTLCSRCKKTFIKTVFHTVHYIPLCKECKRKIMHEQKKKTNSKEGNPET